MGDTYVSQSMCVCVCVILNVSIHTHPFISLTFSLTHYPIQHSLFSSTYSASFVRRSLLRSHSLLISIVSALRHSPYSLLRTFYRLFISKWSMCNFCLLRHIYDIFAKAKMSCKYYIIFIFNRKFLIFYLFYSIIISLIKYYLQYGVTTQIMKKYNEKEYIIYRVYLARDVIAFPNILSNFDLNKLKKQF